MKLKQLRIENFRSFRDETILFDDYTSFVGPNGAGKSAILMALNVFFRNNASTVTNVHFLSEEDFHLRNTKHPVKITATFEHLPPDAQTDLKHYYRQNQLVVTAKAEWNEQANGAEVLQYGSRLVMKQFAPFFEGVENKAKVGELQSTYNDIRKSVPELAKVTTKTAMTEELRTYEESHPEGCEQVESKTQFYGWSKGSNLLNKYLQWIYIPAVKDASSEQDESTTTALGQLLKRTIRTRINFTDELSALQGELEGKYKSMIDAQQTALDDLQASIEKRLQQWGNPNAELSIKWTYDPDKSFQVNEPFARVAIGEDDFMGEVARLGHGMQRAFIVSMLQELAASDEGAEATLLLGFEEPELYQHPPQAQHMADLLETLGDDPANEVIVTTHSPYFVSCSRFQSVRMVRKTPPHNCTRVSRTTYEEVADAIGAALREEPRSPSSLMASVEQIMRPSQRELFFCSSAIIVEGPEDLAFVSSYLKLTKRWSEFRRLGCHFVVSVGKTNLSRPLAIANALAIPAFVIFDADVDVADKEPKHERDNRCLLNLCGMKDFDPLPKEIIWGPNVVVWPTRILGAVRDQIGPRVWDRVAQDVRVEHDFVEGVSQKNSLLIPLVLEELYEQGIYSQVLDQLCKAILSFANDGMTP